MPFGRLERYLFAQAAVEAALRLVERRFVAVRPVYLPPGFHLEGLVEPVVDRNILQMMNERWSSFAARKESGCVF